MLNKAKNLLLFDVDGTLTESRKKIIAKDFEFWKELSKTIPLGIVGGSDFGKICEQLNVPEKELCSTFQYVFAENGLDGKIHGEQIPRQSLIHFLGDDKYQTFINYVFKLFSEISIPKKRGNFIELRNGMVNISPIGRSCSQSERDEFDAYDKEHNVRGKIVEKLKENFSQYNLDFVIGGQISIDAFPLGWDKRFCLKYIENSFENIHFFGDRTSPGGNDYSIFIDDRTIGHTVKGPEDTIDQVKKLLGTFP
uniref:Phosphomannomutase n=1 Tax=Parastrongyloides trichosuri TaxID=131310 RepID=A0A0N4ZEZ8_PARTI